MNGIISKLMWFVGGALIGAAVTYVYQDKRLSKKFEKDFDDYKEFVDSRANSNTENPDTPDNEETNNENEDDTPIDPSTIPQAAVDAVIMIQEAAKKGRTNRTELNKYSKLTRNQTQMPVDGEPTFDGHHRSIIQGGRDMYKPTANDPYYITAEEFRQLDDHDTGYRVFDLYYNTDDDMICYPDGEVIEDGHMKVGWDIMQDMYDSTDNEFYVKNENLKEAYCIIKNAMIN